MKRLLGKSGGADHSPATILAALLLVALVAAGCVLWFMTVAMRNERLAVQQRLTEIYLNHLSSVQRQLATFWKERQTAIQSIGGSSAAEVFAATVRSNLADSIVIYDASGKPAYPSQLQIGPAGQLDEPKGWDAARELEFQKTNYVAAAEAYGRIAEASPDIHSKARAMQSQAGCLLKAGQKVEALKRLEELVLDSRLRQAMSAQGSLIGPNAQLLVLKLLASPRSIEHRVSESTNRATGLLTSTPSPPREEERAGERRANVTGPIAPPDDSGSSRREEAHSEKSENRKSKSEIDQSLLTSAATVAEGETRTPLENPVSQSGRADQQVRPTGLISMIRDKEMGSSAPSAQGEG
ncbi:MAG: hypothetical protein HY735_19740, partial [Verrucomicrobia bacterium]|nr:hypothetical protein [Verrucomicrobiota bacterium]